MFYSILQHSVRYDILPNVGDFRLLDRRCIDALRLLRENERYTKGLYAFIGFKKCSVPFETQERAAGHSSWNYRSLFSLALQGIVSFTTAPLRFSTIAGTICSILAFIYFFYIVIKTFFFGEPVKGYPTLLSVMLLLGGVQLLSLGIMGEYLGRIFNETKHRPTYIAKEYNGKKETTL